jgi:N-acetylmuramoyl-L-alanine amidase
MNLNNFFVITKKELLIGMIIILFIFGLLGSGITQQNTFSKLEKIIIIDAGHGGIDSGTSNKESKEKYINLKIAKHLANYLKKGSLKVIMTRNNDSLYQNSRRKDIIHRAKLANKKNADLFISIHVNSFPGTRSFGGQTFYTPNSKKSKALAKTIQEELINIQPKNYRKIKPGPFYVLEKTKMPAVLIEVGFLSNPEDYRRLTSQEIRKKIAKAIANGTIKYLNSNLHLPSEKSNYPESSNENTVEETTVDNKFKLYFGKSTGNNELLCPVSKEITVTKIISITDLSITEKIAAHTLQALINGPENKRKLYPVIPPKTKLLGIKVKNKIAYVNFSEELLSQHWGGSTSELLTIHSIIKTLTQFSKIEKVQILIENQKENLIYGHLLLNHPLSKKDLPN